MRSILITLASILMFGCAAPREADFEISAHVVDAAGKPVSGRMINLEAVRFEPDAELSLEAKSSCTTDANGDCGPIRFTSTVVSGGSVTGHATVPETDVSGQVNITYDDVGDDHPTIAKTIELKLP